MGCTFTHISNDPETRRINKELARDGAKEGKVIKLLLLGTGDSGKSTIMKQVKILHNQGFTEEEIRTFKPIVVQNIFSSMNAILDAMETLGIPFGNESNNELKKSFLELDGQVAIPEDSLERTKVILTSLWKDPGLQACFERRNEFQLQDSAVYFFSSLDRIFRKDYLPTTEDVLKFRVRTTGVIEAPFQVKYHGRQLTFKMIDVGGQRSERRKWIHCFENVNSILFVVAISEYNQVLLEDEKTNRMDESLKLFDKIVNNPFFVESSFILFLNKTDLFLQKLEKFPLSDFNPRYEGSNSNDAKEFIALEYLSKVKKKDTGSKKGPKAKTIYKHFTCATNTDQIKVIFTDVVEMIIEKNLLEAGMK